MHSALCFKLHFTTAERWLKYSPLFFHFSLKCCCRLLNRGLCNHWATIKVPSSFLKPPSSSHWVYRSPFFCIWRRFKKSTCAEIVPLCVINHLLWWNSVKNAHRFGTPYTFGTRFGLFLWKGLASYRRMWVGKLHQHLIEHFPQARVNSSLAVKISLFSTFFAAYAALPVPLTQSLINFMKFEFQSWKWTRDPAMVLQQNERPWGA